MHFIKYNAQNAQTTFVLMLFAEVSGLLLHCTLYQVLGWPDSYILGKVMSFL